MFDLENEQGKQDIRKRPHPKCARSRHLGNLGMLFTLALRVEPLSLQAQSVATTVISDLVSCMSTWKMDRFVVSSPMGPFETTSKNIEIKEAPHTDTPILIDTS